MDEVVLDEDGGTVTLEHVPWKGEHWYELRLLVEPGRRGRGVGTRLWAAADGELTARGATVVQVEIAGDDPVALGFAERRGFAVTQRFAGMRLDLTSVDEALLAAAGARAAAAGIRVRTVAEAAAELGRDEAERKLYELNRRLSPDVPGNGETFPPYETYRAEVVGADWFRPEHQYVAAAGSHWVGLVGLGVRPEEGIAGNEFSAVDPAYRRRGVATALKARAALDARALGLHAMVTGNDETNTGILAVNRALGFVRDRGVIRLRQDR